MKRDEICDSDRTRQRRPACGCGDEDNATTKPALPAATAGNMTATIKAGAKIAVPNADAAPHTITDEGSGKAFDSGTIKGKASGSFTVDTPGTYKYICEFHPFMKGELMVTK